MVWVEELVKGARIQRTSYKQVVEVWKVCKKVHKSQRSEEVLLGFMFE